MLLIFGYALSLDVDRIPTIVYDLDQTPQSRDLIREFRGSRYFEIVEEVHELPPIEQAMDCAPRLLGVVIPRRLFAQPARRRSEAQVQLLLDGSDSNTASIAQGYAEGIVANLRRSACDGDAQSCSRADVPPTGVSAECASGTTPICFRATSSCPGLIAVIMMIIAGNLSSLTIAREWENGTMEQLLSTPVRPVRTGAGQAVRLLPGGRRSTW